mmetsp:Transcript_4065/g.6628  ORF Transcript_4065/g.6628 Transcript_4065/m.6628 type:complete len:143 (+) Transcript_4065:178-606(+)
MVPTPNPNALENKIKMSEVEKHNKESDAWMVIGNFKNSPETGPKVYNVTEYLDEHPGGPEVMLDVAGKDADSMFEDIGHSKQARKTMEKYLIGVLDVTEEEKAQMLAEAEKGTGGAMAGIPIVPLLIVLLAIGAYFYLQSQK